ncbi:MAG: hypothetical protein LBV18_00925 [Alistipes sp.]|jgi:hypothetical protein|nr:hypothetical protein [Alistipes sp.]
MRRIIILAALLFAAVHGAAAQTPGNPQLKWSLRFDTKFDNHENDELRYLAPAVNSMTLFSTRLVPAVGFGWSDGNGGRHTLMAGASLTWDISENRTLHPREPIVFYNFSSDAFDIYAGKFERRNLIGGYSRAIFAGVATFYDNVVDGIALQYHPTNGKLELVLDWDGIKTATNRESFRIMSGGEWRPVDTRAVSWFMAGYSFDLYHLASSIGGGEGVVDHFAVNPWVGVDFVKFGLPLDVATLQVGWFQTMDRDRAGADRWLTPGGATIEAAVQKWGVGVRNRLYLGDPLMPLRGVAGVAPFASKIYRGDPFYSAIADTRVYNYTYIYWLPKLGDYVNFEVSAGLHTDGRNVGFQQTLGVSVAIDDNMFRKKTAL